MCKKFITIITFMLLLLISTSVKAAAFTDNQIVDSNKTWTIHFNDEVLLDDLTKQDIVVTDSNGNNVNAPVKFGQDNKTIIVSPPKDEYKFGEKYKLNIGTKVHNKNNNSIRNTVTLNFSIKSEERGNTNSNIIDNGLFAGDGNYIYYNAFSTDHKLYRMNKDGTNKIKLSDDEACNINVYEGYVYYINQGDNSKIYRVKVDGTERIKLNDEDRIHNINITNGFIYYINKNYMICKTKLDGSCKTNITYDAAQFLNVENGWIYYRNSSDDGKVYKVSINGGQRTKLNDDNVNTLVVQGNFIYYTKLATNGIFKMDLDGNNNTKVHNEGISINVSDKYIYFSLSSGAIYRMDLDGENIIKLSEGTPMNYINVIGDSIYFIDITNKTMVQ
ncbi:DUF5050 domain-containing protein [Clostridium hydrogenum]|uniref:DUF5050 domain-containing protein n=1 Tax=Clostridium hydrogenum TaxID=2855764 RepID=UPI001F3FE8CD|nr:DUF5050 domain-containing protein [Clostridium hydrogenum]